MPSKIPSKAEHEKWMLHALGLARLGEALTSPNPMVGAVLVRGGRIVGEGLHIYDGLRHAEIVALEAAGDAARGATLYVTLEPCCHTGRTGPCTRAIINAGVARIVGAMTDPNPEVAGRGFRELRGAGIEVIPGILQDEARQLNEAFATWITAQRPFVTLKSAMTLDGQLVLPASPPKRPAKRSLRGKPDQKIRWITSPASRAEVQRMRHACDAILTGIGTVLADDPLLTDRTGLPRRRRLLRVVLDSQLRLSPRSQLARTAKGDVLVFTCESASGKRARALRRAGVEIFECRSSPGSVTPPNLSAVRAGILRKRKRPGDVRLRSGSHPNLHDVLAELARRGILSVLLEAGATLNQAALSAGVVDKVRLFYAPILAGSQLSGVSKSGGVEGIQLTALSDLRIERFGPDFAVEAYVRKT